VGKFGNALSFNGVNNYVEVADSSSLDITGVITIEAWIYPTAVSDYRCIVAKRLGNFANYVLRLNGGKVEFYYSGPLATGAVTDWNVWATSSSVVSTGSWYHIAVAFTFAGGPIAVYVDGASQSGSWMPGDSSDPATPNDYLLRIGMAYPGYPQYFKGLIDEVRIWSSVLDANQLDDMLPPAITSSNDGQTYLLNQVVAANGAATDGGTGVASVTTSVANLDTSSVGTHTFTVTATDYAKNEANKTVTYYVNYVFNGFLPPVSLGKPFKLGSTIPIKFQLTDAQGAFITNASPLISLKLLSSGSPTGEVIEGNSSGAANTDSIFRYDPNSNQYIFNLATKDLTANAFYRITVELRDGTTQQVDIGLK
jgi:hypothetical protein